MKLSKVVVVVMMFLMLGAMSVPAHAGFGGGGLINVTDESVDNSNDIDIDVDPRITNINSDINSNRLDSDISNNANVDNKNTNINTDINTNKVSNDTDVKQGQVQGQGQKQNNKQVIAPKQSVSFKTERNRIPSHLMRIPGFLSIPRGDVKTWSENAVVIGKDTWNIAELADFSTTRCLGFLWPEWDGNIKIEIRCWSKGKATKKVRIVEAKNMKSVDMKLYTLVGRGKARAENFFRDVDQCATAVGHHASKVGVDLIVVSKFSTAVATAQTAVVGGGGVTSKGDVINMSGGFGGASSEKLMRARGVADLYRLNPVE
jgi:hypothetical protein